MPHPVAFARYMASSAALTNRFAASVVAGPSGVCRLMPMLVPIDTV